MTRTELSATLEQLGYAMTRCQGEKKLSFRPLIDRFFELLEGGVLATHSVSAREDGVLQLVYDAFSQVYPSADPTLVAHMARVPHAGFAHGSAFGVSHRLVFFWFDRHQQGMVYMMEATSDVTATVRLTPLSGRGSAASA